MCQHCASTTVWAEPLDDEDADAVDDLDDALTCQWLPDDEDVEDVEDITGVMCHERPTWVIHETYVEMHLCQEHMVAEDRSIDEGLGDFLRAFGLQDACDFLPIPPTDHEVCEYTDPQRIMDGDEEPPACGAPALYAKRVLEHEVLCDLHAGELGAG